MYKAFTKSDNGPYRIYLNGQKIMGRWIEGDLLRLPYDEDGNANYYIITEVDWWDDIYEIDKYAWKVIPETVCETIRGLKDKHGTQVFEHDLITLHPMVGIYEVRWNKNQCRYDLYLNDYPVVGMNQDTIQNYEVIGTIFEEEDNK